MDLLTLIQQHNVARSLVLPDNDRRAVARPGETLYARPRRKLDQQGIGIRVLRIDDPDRRWGACWLAENGQSPPPTPPAPIGATTSYEPRRAPGVSDTDLSRRSRDYTEVGRLGKADHSRGISLGFGWGATVCSTRGMSSRNSATATVCGGRMCPAFSM